MKFSLIKKLALSTSALVLLFMPAVAAQPQSVQKAVPVFSSVQVTNTGAIPHLRGIYSTAPQVINEANVLRHRIPASPSSLGVHPRPALVTQPQFVRHGAPAFSCVPGQADDCLVTNSGAIPRMRGTYDTAPLASTEGDILRHRTSPSPFKISVDGRTVAGSGFDYEAAQRVNDVALAATDIQVKFDGLNIEPKLNVGLQDDAVTVSRHEQMVFRAYSNYEAFIQRAEIRIFNNDQTINDRPIAIIPVDPAGVARAGVPFGTNEIFYQLRVYDHLGRYDETQPKTVSLVDNLQLSSGTRNFNAGVIGGYGVDRTLTRNIQIRGGAVTVNGVNVPRGYLPIINGRSAPVDRDGKFVTQQILPYGDQQVDVRVLNQAQQGVNFQRNIHIKDTDFFYVALGDITLGQRAAVGPADLTAASDEDFDDVVVNGRGAFYLKGKVRGDYLITAAMDTGEARIKDIFKNLDDKDPKQLLRRLDADRFYPVYGDDSYTHEDAPTQGRFFVRVDKNDSHVQWGNFATQITGTEFAQLDRGLYGAIADYNSVGLTRSGERRTEATIFAADPGTIPGRDEFRGTGGSVYFLKQQDLSIGSERVRIEIRDKVSGHVIETRNLRPQEDYDIDYIQGRILLSEPLQSTVSDGQVVRSGSLSGNEAYLVTRYEFTPNATDIDGFTLGGRATQWVNDNIRVGATAQNDKSGEADQELYGADLLLRRSDNTFVKLEYARTKGPGFGQSDSTDGGFIFDDIQTPGASGLIADAYRLETRLRLADLNSMFDKIDTRLSALLEHSDEGFSGVGAIGNGEVDRVSLGLQTHLSPNSSLNVEYEEVESSRRGDTRAVYADVSHAFNRAWLAKLGIRHDDVDTAAQAANLSANRTEFDGTRTDVSGELTFSPSDTASIRGFAQRTIDKDDRRSENSRYGIGADIQVSEKLTLSGEVSDGDGGLGAQAQATFKKDDNTEFYLGYALSTDRSDTGFATEREGYRNSGVLTAGGRSQLNDNLSVYAEEQYGHGDRGQQLTHTYGLQFAPDEKWTFGASVENGTIDDEIDGSFERTAFSVSAGRVSEGLRVASQLEARFEDGVVSGTERDRTTWLMRNTLAFDANQDIEALARFNFAKSEADDSNFLNADYVEGVVGLAYRPIRNDRLNALAKYTYFEDLAPAQQLSITGASNLARQKSQIVSIDGTYDVSPRLSLGGKFGWRQGEVALDRGSDDYVDSEAYLGVARAEYHLIKRWDALAEARILKSTLADNTQLGALVGLYRHVGDNLKIGGGYNFSKFSDDLTDFDNESDGFFLNVVGKF